MCKKELKEKRTTMKKSFLIVFPFPEEFTNLFLLNVFLFLSATDKQGAGMALVTTRQCGIAVNMQTWAIPAL